MLFDFYLSFYLHYVSFLVCLCIIFLSHAFLPLFFSFWVSGRLWQRDWAHDWLPLRRRRWKTAEKKKGRERRRGFTPLELRFWLGLPQIAGGGGVRKIHCQRPREVESEKAKGKRSRRWGPWALEPQAIDGGSDPQLMDVAWLMDSSMLTVQSDLSLI